MEVLDMNAVVYDLSQPEKALIPINSRTDTAFYSGKCQKNRNTYGNKRSFFIKRANINRSITILFEICHLIWFLCFPLWVRCTVKLRTVAEGGAVPL